MGSRGTESPPPDNADVITVLVTGFAPFQAHHPLNPSWEITQLLPSFLPPSKHALGSDNSLIPQHPPVQIIIYPEPILVAYSNVRSLVPKLWEWQKIDYLVHIGMASGRKYYSVERRGHRDGYIMKDVKGELLGDDERRKTEGENWIWHGLPEEISTDLDIDDVCRRWRAGLPGLDVRVSEDAGRYLCDFIYYSSLAYLTRKEEDKTVTFLHVPPASDNIAVQTGVDVTLELIRSIVESDRTRNKVIPQQKSNSGNGS